MSMSLQGKVALITGAGKGIGRATALALAKDGVSFGHIAMTQSDLEAFTENVKTYSEKVDYETADVASYTDVQEAVENLYKTLGKFDILINNAGIAKFGSFLELPVEEWEKIINVNLFGMYYV